LGTQDDAKLRARALTELARVALLLLRDGRKTNDISRFLSGWRETFQIVAAAPNGLGAMLAVIRYLSRVAQSTQQELETFAREIGPTAEKATMTAAEEIAKNAEERGRREGREEGRRFERHQLLVKLISLRFGAPDEATLARLERATPEQLSECAERVISATTLKDVLEGCR
jgi:hypothetical protein